MIDFKLIDTSFHFQRSFGSLTYSENDRVSLKTIAKHHGSWVWYLQNKRLVNSSISRHFKFPNPLHYGIVHGSVLEIHQIKERHKGVYKVTFDIDGCQESKEIRIKVAAKQSLVGR